MENPERAGEAELMENSVRKKAAAKKQEFIPRPVRESPVYELKSVSDLGISSLYGVRIDGKEVEVFQNEFFHFAIPVYEKKGREREVEVTIPDDVKSVRLRPASAGISFERDGSVLKFRVPAGLRVIVEIDGDLLCPLYIPKYQNICTKGY